MSDSSAHKADDHQPSILFQYPKVAVKVRAANDIQNDIHAFIVGQLADFFRKIIGFVVNRRSIGT